MEQAKKTPLEMLAEVMAIVMEAIMIPPEPQEVLIEPCHAWAEEGF